MSDLLVSQCGHCRGSDETRSTNFEYIVEKSMTAKYDGSCPSCGERIIGGETIVGATEGGWICEGCFR